MPWLMGSTVQQLDPALSPKDILASLDPPVLRLIAAVKTLYLGQWDDCAEDIRRRRAGKPYLFKLSLETADELEWIHRLQAYEAARGESFVLDDIPGSASSDPHREDLR